MVILHQLAKLQPYQSIFKFLIKTLSWNRHHCSFFCEFLSFFSLDKKKNSHVLKFYFNYFAPLEGATFPRFGNYFQFSPLLHFMTSRLDCFFLFHPPKFPSSSPLDGTTVYVILDWINTILCTKSLFYLSSYSKLLFMNIQDIKNDIITLEIQRNFIIASFTMWLYELYIYICIHMYLYPIYTYVFNLFRGKHCVWVMLNSDKNFRKKIFKMEQCKYLLGLYSNTQLRDKWLAETIGSHWKKNI